MSDIHERLMLCRNVEQVRPYARMNSFWDFEVERRSFRQNSYAKVAVGLSRGLGTLVLTIPGLGFGRSWFELAQKGHLDVRVEGSKLVYLCS